MFGWLRSTGNDASARITQRVLLAISSYRDGGAERVVTTPSHRLSLECFENHLVVVQNEGQLG